MSSIRPENKRAHLDSKAYAAALQLAHSLPGRALGCRQLEPELIAERDLSG